MNKPTEKKPGDTIDNGFHKLNIQKLPPIVLESHAAMKKVYQTLVEESRGQIYENAFVEHFLPFFAGVKDVPPDRKIFDDWVALAGSVNSPLDVVDENGKVLFTTPPPVDTSGIQVFRQKNDKSLLDIMTYFEMEKAGHPGAAAINRDRSLEERSKTLLTNASEKNREEWSAICSRYQIQQTGDKNQTVGVSNSKDGLDGGEEVSFD